MSTAEPAPRSEPTIPAEIASVVFRLRRALSQSTHPDLTPAKYDAMRVVYTRPGLSVLDVARALGIARNTASTVVTSLITLGWVERRRDELDARIACLYPSRRALARKARQQDWRDVQISAALGALTPAERSMIEAALPPLKSLLLRLETQRGDLSPLNRRTAEEIARQRSARP